MGINHAGDKELFSAVARNFADGILQMPDEVANSSLDQIGPECDTSDTNFFDDKCLGFTSTITLNYAVWTLQETRSEVSEPATLALAGVSLLALAGNRRKRWAVAAG